MKKPTDAGANRTGIQASPAESKRTIEGATAGTPDDLVTTQPFDLHATRVERSIDAEPIGSMPSPGGAKGAVKAAVRALQGVNRNVFLDQLGARLAFERAGTRLYDALLVKHEAADVHVGGPSRDELEQLRDQEREHAAMLAECIEQLGADPTVVTPAADIQSTAGHGVLQVVADPRTTLTQSLEAVLIAELADNDSWQVLIDLAEGLGQDEFVDGFERALGQEQRHLMLVRGWLSSALAGQAGIDPTPRLDRRRPLVQ